MTWHCTEGHETREPKEGDTLRACGCVVEHGVVRWEGGRVIGRILDVREVDDGWTVRMDITDEAARDAFQAGGGIPLTAYLPNA